MERFHISRKEIKNYAVRGEHGFTNGKTASMCVVLLTHPFLLVILRHLNYFPCFTEMQSDAQRGSTVVNILKITENMLRN